MEAKERRVEAGGTAELERALVERETAFRCLLDCASDAYLVYDGKGRIADANERAGEVWRLPDSALRGRSLVDLVDSEAAGAELTSVDAAEAGPRTVAFLGRCRDGESFRAEARIGLLDPDGPRFMALVRDVSDRERTERQLRFLESHDPLTGLPNCKLLLDQARSACARAESERRQVALLHVDLNRFRLINQGLGSEGGDELLRQVSSRLRGAARPMDVVARYSADEFLLLAPDLEWESPDQPGAGAGGVAAAHSLAERIHGSLERPFDLGGREIYVDAAVGVSLFPVDADGPEGLLRHADAAAQQAKRPADGPTKLFAGETSDKWARLWLATRLRKAVEREELLLHYQPIVALDSVGVAAADGDLAPHIVAVEALVRWCDSDGIVPPAGFIPLAEDLGIIESIGEWVLAEACRETAGWRSRGEDLQVSFNLSVQELWQGDVVTRIAQQVRESGLEPGSVIVEVTESSAMTDPVRATEVLSGLRDAGLTIAMDDFGAGYSSLGRLSEFPCEILKIDRAFVSRLPEDPGAAAMVTAMVELAKGLGMRTVAEGIETPEQLEVLRERGCELGQGYLFSKPVPPKELPLS